MTLEWWLEGYLYAWIFWTGLCMGCTGLLLLHHSIKPRWGVSILRILEAGWKLIPVMALLFIPIAIAYYGQYLYPWADPTWVRSKDGEVMRHRYMFNNPLWFTIRTIIYFAFWFIAGLPLINSVRRQERVGNPEEIQFRANWATPCLVFHILITTIAMTDWVMSLGTRWYSTVFGCWFLTSQALNACAFATAILAWGRWRRRGPYADIVDKPLMRDLGNVILALTMFWAYFTLAQFLIIWSGNLPEENAYYALRMGPGWNPLGAFIVYFQFFVPFLLLIYNGTKRSAPMLFGTCCLVMFLRMLDVYWCVMPFFSLRPGRGVIGVFGNSIPALVFFAVVGAIWLGLFSLVWRRSTPYVTYDPRVAPIGTTEAVGHA